MFFRLTHWQHNPDLAAVRDNLADIDLPGADREQWNVLWGDAERLRKQVAGIESRLPAVGPGLAADALGLVAVRCACGCEGNSSFAAPPKTRGCVSVRFVTCCGAKAHAPN